MRYDENGQQMLDLDGEQASWDEAGDCLLNEGVPFAGWAFENYEDGQLYSRTQYARGYATGLLEIYYEGGQLMCRNGDYELGGPYPINRAWAENGRLILEEMNRSIIRVPAYQKEWSESGVLIYAYQSPATYQTYRHGEESWWYEHGQLKERKRWVLGVLITHQSWTEEGQISLDYRLQEGVEEEKTMQDRLKKELEMVARHGELAVMNGWQASEDE